MTPSRTATKKPRPAPPYRRRSSMHEVADLAGVALSSVSRVLSDHPDVSPSMRIRVVRAIEELGYVPDFLAQSLRRGATLTVGFVVGDISNPLLSEIALGAESVLRAAGYSMLLMSSENNPEEDAAHIRFFSNRRVDGMILSLASERKKATLDELVRLDGPVVVVDRDVPARARASAVLSDHAAGMTRAATRLVELGHTNIAFIGGSPDIRATRERLRAIRAVAARSRKEVSVIVDTGTFSPSHGEVAMDAYLEMAETPTAVIVGGNQLIIGVLRSMQRHRVRPGRDIALVTCDDIPVAELLRPPIAAVARDNVLLGRTAAELLLERMRDKSAEPRSVVLPTEFVERGSCGPPQVRAGGRPSRKPRAVAN